LRISDTGVILSSLEQFIVDVKRYILIILDGTLMIDKNQADSNDRLRKDKTSYLCWFAVIVIILTAGGIRFRLVDVPLERDEGEYAYAGQLILDGTAPYGQVYSMKMPGIHAAYAVILAVFGQTQGGVHFGLLVINAVSILVIFLLAKEFFGQFAAISAAAAFALLSLGKEVQGIFANAEHFVIASALCGIFFLVHGINREKYWPVAVAGVFVGVSFLMKQHGIFFIAFCGLYLIFIELRRRPFVRKPFAVKCALYLFGALVPFGLTCLILRWCGVFGKFWFWTFEYAGTYAAGLPLSEGLDNLTSRIADISGSSIWVWILAGFGLTALFWSKEIRRYRVFAASFVFFSILAICPGFYFRRHYFILLLPAVALLAGIGARAFYELFGARQSGLTAKSISTVLVCLALFDGLYQQRQFLFFMNPTEASRATYGTNPFPESLEAARYIKENSTGDDLIAVIGSEPQIYFYSKRRSATSHIYTYPLMEGHEYALKMQEEMIEQIESKKPNFLVYVHVFSSWFMRPESEKMIFQWIGDYQRRYYRVVGVMDIISANETIERWGEEAGSYLVRSESGILILERRSEIKDVPPGPP